MLADMHIHGMGHGERGQTAEALEPFILAALAGQQPEMGFTDHDWVQTETDFDLFRWLQKKYPQIRIAVGLEVDYIAGREKAARDRLAGQPYDYVLGGVHHIGADHWPFDHPDYRDGWQQCGDAAEIYRLYFQTVEKAAASGLFQVMPHLDLIKVFGCRPAGPVLPLLGSLLETIRAYGLAVEINTAGLFKPAAEIYPQPAILAECRRLEIPVTFGSDAHQAQDVGRRFTDARQIAWDAGYRQYVTLRQGEKISRRL